MALESVNPATGELRGSFAEQSAAQVKDCITKAYDAFCAWRQSGFSERSRLLMQAAHILVEDKKDLAKLMSTEMGKPVRQAEAEIDKCAMVCVHYAENAEKMLDAETIASDTGTHYIRFDPLGPILAVMPWNFPFWQVFRFAAPALMAGNVCLLKHSSNVPDCSRHISAIFRKAGFPEHVFSEMRIGSGLVEAVIDHPLIAAVTLTGSEQAGRKIAAQAGRNLKKVVLELGGSDPFIVLADAPLQTCLPTAVQARMINNGQSCIAAKRFIVETNILERFRSEFITAVEALKVGDPLEPGNDLGPLARTDLVDELERQVKESVRLGARVLTGGKRMSERSGFYFQPTVLGDVKPGMPAYEEEMFGPVAALISAEDAEDAVRIANDTPFGLGASIWTLDLPRAEKLAAGIDAGMVFINGLVRSDPRLPFGGIKQSGYGRELSHYGIKEFVNIKTVVIS
ncbi:MAG: NAD-dependent succinate-semialdehyde dehydrogenase [Candidatus Aminicenantes bacterium]|nr:NAD-dependent succinate-semialdehyde dehydrogenase [Candidatus Aminicenantes bacterium]